LTSGNSHQATSASGQSKTKMIAVIGVIEAIGIILSYTPLGNVSIIVIAPIAIIVYGWAFCDKGIRSNLTIFALAQCVAATVSMLMGVHLF
jgi:ABC-type hemin transport system substrate-binding protein